MLAHLTENFFSDFPELTELLEGIKSVRDKIKKKKTKNEDIYLSRISLSVSVRPL